MRAGRLLIPSAVLVAIALAWRAAAFAEEATRPDGPDSRGLARAKMLVEYFEAMSAPKPFRIREREEFDAHRRALQERLLRSTGLSPLPERIPLDPRLTDPLEHPWCRVRRVYYQLWPGVYSSGLLYSPKELPERPAPAMLCPHGHWQDGNAHPIVQTRCLVFAKLGYVVFSPMQQHYEDLAIGISHQTIGIWSNIRAIDYLQSLPEVDGGRIAACGCSGGGLQTQMLCAVEGRLKAATIVGMTCDFREILFPHASHCNCNHYPGATRSTDAPELSALGLPLPVQYITMNDWTRGFGSTNFPAIRSLYDACGATDRLECLYEPTEHTYDRSKREATYRWMERWLRARDVPAGGVEPERVQTFPPERIKGLALKLDGDGAFARVSGLYRRGRGYKAPSISGRAEWEAYRDRMVGALVELLGEESKLPRGSQAGGRREATPSGGLLLTKSDFPSEGPIRVPAVLVEDPASRPEPARSGSPGLRGSAPGLLLVSGRGTDALLEDDGPGSPRALSREGRRVVVADPRFAGQLSWAALAPVLGPELVVFRPSSLLGKAGDPARQAEQLRVAWERNSIVWGRPIPGMTATDIRGVIDGVLEGAFQGEPPGPRAAIAPGEGAGARGGQAGGSVPDASGFCVTARDSPELAVATLFAALLDRRICAVDVDLKGRCFAGGGLPVVPFILEHGDILQWAASLADRDVLLRNPPGDAGELDWLRGVFATLGDAGRLRIE